jgi:hypothetical protein
MTIHTLMGRAVVALGLAVGGASAASAATTVNLGFAIDHSGSISGSEYTLQKNGLANALAQLVPTGNVQYRVGVITFGNDVKTLVAPTVVSAANIGTIQTAITSHNRSNTGSTQTGAAINALTTAFDPFITNTLTLFNLSTDGVPCCQNNAQTLAETAAANAVAAGVDGISVELVGNFNQTQINNMLAITSPTPSVYITAAADLPDPSITGFVFGVDNFLDYEAAIGAKIQQITDIDPVPLPAAAWMLLSGIAGLGMVARKRRAA